LRIAPPAGGERPRTFAWSPDGKRLAAGTSQGLRLYKPWENAQVPLLQDRTQQKIGRLVWTTDGKQLIVEGEPDSKRLEVWDADKFERTGALDGLLEKGHRVSPDGHWVVTGSAGKVHVGDLTRKNKTVLSWDDPGPVWLPAWSPDSRR